MRFLLQHLRDRILATKEDRLCIYSHGSIPSLFSRRMDWIRIRRFNRDTGIVHHAMFFSLVVSLDQLFLLTSRKTEELTYPTFHIPEQLS